LSSRKFTVAVITIPLDVPDIEIIKLETNTDNDLIITVKNIKPTTCNKCKKKMTKIHGYADTIFARHVSLFEQPVYIEIRPVRFQCQYCKSKRTQTEQFGWYNPRSRVTKKFEKHLMCMLINSTVIDVAKKVGTTEDIIYGAFERQVSEQVDWDKIYTLEILGIDEISIKKGHKDFVAIISSRAKGKTTVLAVLPNRKKKTVKNFLEQIPERLKCTITKVCTDMYDGYINAAQEVFENKIPVVADRFHVARLYRKPLDTLRKKELKRLKLELSEEKYKELKGAMWALRKDPTTLDEESATILSKLFGYSPIIQLVYQFMLSLTKIFETDLNKMEASKEIKKWIKTVMGSGLDCYDKFISTLNKYWDNILNYFHRKSRMNSGFVEGMNNKIKTMKRRCYGLTNIASIFKRIFLDVEGYDYFSRVGNQAEIWV
jgi:transposase